MAKPVLDTSEFLYTLSNLTKESVLPNIKKYVPHEKQVVFHQSEKKKKLYIGGNRSGKTYGGVAEGIWRATCRHPYRTDLNEIGPNRGRVAAVDFVNGVEKFIFPLYKQLLYPSAIRGGAWETAYDKVTRTLWFENGSFIEFMSYDQDLDKFAGTSRHWVHFDEEPPQTIYVECMARLIDTDGDFWITMTPVEGMTWVHDDLYEKNVNNPEGVVEVIEINTLENPYLNQGAIESFIDSISEEEKDARVGGQFVRMGGRIYKNFDPTIGSTHVLANTIEDPKNYLKDWLWIMCLDHGLKNPTAVEWIAINENGFGVVFDEWYKNEMTIEQHSKAIIDKIRLHGRRPDIMVADPSIQNRSAVTMTSIHEEYNKYGLNFILGNNDVKAGIIRVKKYFNMHEYVGRRDHPLFVDKNDAAVNKFPRLRVDPRCVNLISEAKKYRWKVYRDKRLQFENNPYDEPQKKDDHALDALRYGLMTQPDLFAEQETQQTSFKNALEEAMDQASLNDIILRDVDVVFPQQRERADPFNIEEGGWNSNNSMPSREGGGWAFDEHMGIDY